MVLEIFFAELHWRKVAHCHFQTDHQLGPAQCIVPWRWGCLEYLPSLLKQRNILSKCIAFGPRFPVGLEQPLSLAWVTVPVVYCDKDRPRLGGLRQQGLFFLVVWGSLGLVWGDGLGSAWGLATSLSLLRATGPGCSSVESFGVEEGEGGSCGPALPACQHFQQLMWATHGEIYADPRSL